VRGASVFGPKVKFERCIVDCLTFLMFEVKVKNAFFAAEKICIIYYTMEITLSNLGKKHTLIKVEQVCPLFKGCAWKGRVTFTF